jgi:HEAT repeat protein
MIAPSEFQRYLQEICLRYEHWWTVDALTETIADRQATFSFEQMVQNLEKKSEEEKKAPIPSLPIFQEIQNYVESEHILLVGSPGVGKSTGLLRCLVDFAKKELEKPEPRIPVLIPLKYKVSFSSPEDPSGMLSLIRDALKPLLLLTIPEVEELLFQKRLILLLDGLNEMPADTVRTQLKKFREGCDQIKIPLICTTRELGNGDLGIKRRLQVQPLGSREIERFLRECMPAQRQQVLQLLSRDNRELSRTPFVLWMLYQLFQETGTVVDTLGQAFGQFFQTFKKYKEDAPVTDERRKAWNPWLEHLAFTMLNSPEPNDPGLIISDERAEKLLVEKFGDLHGAPSRIEELVKYHVLERVSDREVSFQHQLIQEYYAAERLAPQLEKLSDEELQYYYLNYLKWTEPLAMAMSFVKSEALAVRMVKLALEVDLYLGARLAGEATLSLQKATVNIILQKGFQPSLIIWLLEQTQSQYALPFLFDIHKNGCSDTRWRATRALGKFANIEVLRYLIEALKDQDSSVRQKAVESLGKLGNSEAVPNLCQLLDDEYFLVRSFVIDVLGKLEGRAAIDCLKSALKHDDSTVKTKAAEFLGQRVPQEVIALLNEEFNNGNADTKRDTLQLLGETKNAAAIPILIRALSESEWIVRSQAVFQIGLLGIWLDSDVLEDGVTALIHILQSDPENSVRSTAAISLAGMGHIRAVPVLIEALSKDDPVVRSSAAYALGRLQDRSAISELIRALKDIDDNVCQKAIISLRILNAVEVLPTLRKLLQYKPVNVRAEIILSLGFFGDSKDIPSLYQSLKDQEFLIQLRAAYSLTKLNNRKGLPILEDALKTGNKDARERALGGLKNFHGKVGLSSIVSTAFTDDEYSIRKEAVDFLEAFKESQEIVNELKKALNNLNEDICRNAMDAAKTIGNAEILSRLRQLAETITVVERPLEAIAAIQSRCQFYNYGITRLPPPHRTKSGEGELEDSLYNKLDILTQEFKKVSEEPKRVIHTNNYYEKGTHTHNHNYANDETLKQQTIELRQWVHQLQQTHQPTTEVQAAEIIDVEFREIQNTNPTRWQTIRKQLQLLKRQLLNPESHFKATKATLAEVAKHYLEESLVSKAVITYLDTMSADPD